MRGITYMLANKKFKDDLLQLRKEKISLKYQYSYPLIFCYSLLEGCIHVYSQKANK